MTRKELGSQIGRHHHTIANWEEGGRPEHREDIFRLQRELHLSQFETDQLLYAAGYLSEYNSPIAGISPSTAVEIGPDRELLDRRMQYSSAPIYGYLYLKRGDDNDRIYALRGDRVIIGRHPGKCDIVIPELYTHASRVHATLSRDRGDSYIEDSASKYGTFVDGERVTEPQRLHPGDHILLGGRSPRAEVCVLEFSLEPSSTD